MVIIAVSCKKDEPDPEIIPTSGTLKIEIDSKYEYNIYDYKLDFIKNGVITQFDSLNGTWDTTYTADIGDTYMVKYRTLKALDFDYGVGIRVTYKGIIINNAYAVNDSISLSVKGTIY